MSNVHKQDELNVTFTSCTILSLYNDVLLRILISVDNFTLKQIFSFSNDETRLDIHTQIWSEMRNKCVSIFRYMTN